MLIPTSGSTGTPKLTIVTDAMLRRNVRAPDHAETLVVLAYEPLRQSVDIISLGGQIGIFSGNLSKIEEDCKVLRPTIFGATPTFWNGMYREFNIELAQRIAVRVSEIDARYTLLKEWQTRKMFGNRCRVAVITGAASSADLRTWLFDALGFFVLDGYGTTETGGLTRNGRPQNPETTKLQLLDRPDLGYTTSDYPFPRGEIIACTSRMTPGYFNAPSSEYFITIGGQRYFRTGDIGEMANGEIRVIDRASSMFKLSQGIFVAPQPLEELYGSSELVSQIFVHGEASMSYVSAIVVPSPLLLSRLAERIPEQSGLQDAIRLNDDRFRPDARCILRKDFYRLARAKNLPSYKIPQHIIIEQTPFSNWNGCLTHNGKLCRTFLRKRYATDLPSKSLASDLPLTREQAASPSEVCQGLQTLLRDVLPYTPAQLSPTDSLDQLISDSITMARICTQIQRRFGVTVPLPKLFQLSLTQLQTLIFGGTVPTSVEKSWEDEVDCAWGPLERIIADRGSHSGAVDGDKVDGILLTGATGLLGIHILSQLLRTSGESQRIYCLVRTAHPIQARERIICALRYYNLSTVLPPNLTVLCGDLSLPHLGVDPKGYTHLQSNIETIFHCGARVNHVLPYTHLYPTNVTGTQNILTLALTSPRHPRLIHISSLAVLTGGLKTTEIPVPASSSNMSHLNGYAQTKFVSEHLVLRSFGRGLKGCIIRIGTISASRKTRIPNLLDSLTLLLEGMVREGVYHLSLDSTPFSKAFCLVDIDWVVESVLRLCEGQAEGIYHLTSQRIITLEEIVSALKSAGHGLTPVSGEEFREKMMSVGEGHPWFVYRFVYVGGGKVVLVDDRRVRETLKGTECEVDLGSLVCGIGKG